MTECTNIEKRKATKKIRTKKNELHMQFIIHIYCVHLHKVNITARLRMSEPLEQARDFFQLERNEKEKISRTTKKNV